MLAWKNAARRMSSHAPTLSPAAKANIPTHIAIIMDGNGRWAKQRGLPRVEGHRNGVESVRATVRACGEIGVKYLTLYAFSVENWNRPQDEVDTLMKYLARFLKNEIGELNKNNVADLLEHTAFYRIGLISRYHREGKIITETDVS